MKLLKYCLGLLLLFVACKEHIDVPPVPSEDTDSYVGIYNEIYLEQETSDFREPQAVMRIKTSSGDVIERDVIHHRQDGKSLFSLDVGLKSGDYRLLELVYEKQNSQNAAKLDTLVYGLGCAIDVSEDGVQVTSSFSSEVRFSGSGTIEDPYVVSSIDHLVKLCNIANGENRNRRLKHSTCFRQDADIEMYSTCINIDMAEGWLPIGNAPETAFPSIYNGAGYSIKGLWINRVNTVASGLFGYVAGATIDSVVMSNASVNGGCGTAALVGVVTTAGDERQATQITNSRVVNSNISGISGGAATGALVGNVDQYVPFTMLRCTADDSTTVRGSYGVGGLVGLSSIFSLTLIADSYNEAPVFAEYSGAGGIVGSADTLYVTSCVNKAEITGGMLYKSGDADNAAIGAGGIAGGSGISFLTSCRNVSNVSGYEGVGGLIGSTRIKGSETDAYVYNNTLLQGCSNTCELVSGQRFVGGLCGEAQFGCFSVYNTASVESSDSYAGGIVGTSSISAIHNALNMGSVDAVSYSSGIVAKTTFGAIALNRNFGTISGNGKCVAGIAGLAGNSTVIHYCSNYGDIINKKQDVTGGIVGEIGDPRDWSARNTTDCVMGGEHLVKSVSGPVIAFIKNAIKDAGLLTEVGTFVGITESGENTVDEVLLPINAIASENSDNEYYSAEDMTKLMLELENQAKADMATVASEMVELQNTAIASIPKSSFDNHLAGKTVIDKTTSIAELCGQDENTGKEFQVTINEKREERYKDIESAKATEAIAHKVLNGVCIAVSLTVLVAASGGTTLGLVAATAINAAVGGANSISKSVDEFTENAAIVSQCVNMGTIRVDGSYNALVGGIVGHLQESCQLKECLNCGGLMGTNVGSGGICGEYGSNSEFLNCLNIEGGWEWPIYDDKTLATFVTSENNYYVYPEVEKTTAGTHLTTEQVCNANSYANWSIGTEYNSLWTIPDPGKIYPVPYQTEMLIEE